MQSTARNVGKHWTGIYLQNIGPCNVRKDLVLGSVQLPLKECWSPVHIHQNLYQSSGGISTDDTPNAVVHPEDNGRAPIPGGSSNHGHALPSCGRAVDSATQSVSAAGASAAAPEACQTSQVGLLRASSTARCMAAAVWE